MSTGEPIVALFVLIVWTCIIISKVSSTAKNRKKENKTYERSPAVQQYYNMHPQKDPARQNGKRKNIQTLSCIMEDRENDWLARQLKDEQRSKVIVSQMFSLKQEHHKNCDAGVVDDAENS